jgi:hypothetical protein
VHHPAGHNELSYTRVKTYEDLVGGKDYVSVFQRRSDGFNLTSGVFQRLAAGVALPLRLAEMDRRLADR